jgi:hypothetical protein
MMIFNICPKNTVTQRRGKASSRSGTIVCQTSRRFAPQSDYFFREGAVKLIFLN